MSFLDLRHHNFCERGKKEIIKCMFWCKKCHFAVKIDAPRTLPLSTIPYLSIDPLYDLPRTNDRPSKLYIKRAISLTNGNSNDLTIVGR